MKQFLNKKKTNQGFTLAELLIVVAIIAVLVAIAIPIFTKRLEASRETTDIANLRSAYAAGMVSVLQDDLDATSSSWTQSGNEYTTYYTPSEGENGLSKTAKDKLGKGTGVDGGADGSNLVGGEYDNDTSYKDQYIKITYDSSDGKVTAEFSAS